MKQACSAFADSGAFREIFFEETGEHLATTEEILLRLDTQAPCPDDLNAIFRAVHSIKGSAAMLGFEEIGRLAHAFENLLDLLRKEERAVEQEDVEAMLAAGDIVKAQVAQRRGQLEVLPDGGPAEARLRQRVAVGVADGAGPVPRRFAVRLGPLAAAIDPGDLDMMLAGLAEMGSLGAVAVDNTSGGLVCFEVTLAGSEADLRSVLALVVPPEHVAVQAHDAAAAAATDGATGLAVPAAPADADNELFVDPAAFRRARQSPPPATADPEPAVELFVTPRDLTARRPPAAAAPVAPAPAAAAAAAAAPAAPAHAATSIRVATDKIDLLVNLVGELVITESMLSRHDELAGKPAGGHKGLADLARHTRDLQEAVLAIRMVPLADVFARFPRLVRELSGRLGKRVVLATSGESTELDRGLMEKISDPLTHLVRNAVDHGLETPEIRVAAGKEAVGTVTLAASQRGGKVVIEVSDDGRGLDREVILAQAARRGHPLPPDAPDAEVWQQLFEAGFSTAQQVTDVSGRGVGLDVVRRNILALGGGVEVTSRAGRGVKVRMTVPLTLAMMDAMTVALGSQVYVLPLASVVESRSLAAGDLHVLPGQRETMGLRGAYLPVLRLARLFPPEGRREHVDEIAVIVEAEGTFAAVVVDSLVGQQQVVVKNLETNFRKVPGVSGATIMSDGSVALILDVVHLIHASGATRVAPS